MKDKLLQVWILKLRKLLYKLFALIEYSLVFDQYNIIEMEKDLIQIDCSKGIEYFLNLL